jgi:Tol biopolymer transport system component
VTRWMVVLGLVALALSTPGAPASSSAPPLVGTLVLSSASGSPGATVLLRGRIPGQPYVKVWLQRRDDGSFVAFDRTRTNGQGRFAFSTFVPDDRSSATYRVRTALGVTRARTVVTGVTTRLTMDPDPTHQYEDAVSSYSSAISGNGRWIAYVSQGGMFLLDRLSGVARPITPPGVDAYAPSLSTDGRFVAYIVGYGPTGHGLAGDIVVFDRRSGTPTHVTSDGLGNVAPSISGDGGRVAYLRYGQKRPFDVYLWERGRQRTSRLTHGRASSGAPDISADGNWVVFSSAAPDLVPDDRNPGSDVFIWSARTGLIRRLTHGISESAAPTVSSDGRSVAFLWTGRLAVGRTGSYGAYLLDRKTGSTQLVSLAARRVTTAEVSDNGHHVVYRLGAGAAPLSRVLIWDHNTGTTTMLGSEVPGAPNLPSASADGRHVVFQASDFDPIYPTDVYLWDRLN